MKFAVVALAFLAVAHAQFAGFSPFSAHKSAPAPSLRLSNVASRVSDDHNARTLKEGSDIDPNGAFNYFFETDNGIAVQAQGSPKDFGGNPPVVPDVIQGSYSFVSPDGQQFSITYVADENGYQPQGNAIPTPPPIPEAIVRSLEYNARNAPRK